MFIFNLINGAIMQEFAVSGHDLVGGNAGEHG